MGLTAVAIKAAKGRDKQYKLADSGGLHLLVLPSGQRYWRMNYRHLGKYKTLAFGVWPDVELADARAKRDEARRALGALSLLGSVFARVRNRTSSAMISVVQRVTPSVSYCE